MAVVLFGKREVVFKVQGDKARGKAARAAVETAGIQIMEAYSYEGDIPLCSCGAKIDRRNYGPNGWIDRRIYYMAVRPENAEQAKVLLADI